MQIDNICGSPSQPPSLIRFQAVDPSLNSSLKNQFAELKPDEYKKYLILFLKKKIRIFILNL